MEITVLWLIFCLQALREKLGNVMWFFLVSLNDGNIFLG